ncbi:hypothetical protein [Nocardia sp. CC201C]|uniref:hypothetical protein n=1 Tax=Nocardia sp. CC201C TaxID=3044575 RepID=UPI0024A8D547|nr:hypothetical protein [Nocardia sp. CC201C]
MSNLWNLVQAHLDNTGVREAEFARRMGSSPQTLNSWKNRGLRALPERRLLDAVADLTGTPYRTVLDAALTDIGYTAPDSDSQATTPIDSTGLVELSFRADDAEVAARAADGFDPSDDVTEVINALDSLVDATYELARTAQRVAIEGIGGRDALAHRKDEELEAIRRRRRARTKPGTEASGPLVTSEGSYTAPQSPDDDSMLRVARAKKVRERSEPRG